ncbi:MAG: AI-2E family transporter [Methylomicrobium sp.]
MSFWDKVRMPANDTMEMEPAGARSINGLLTKRTLIIVSAAAAVIVLLLMVWQIAQILLLIFASLLSALFLRTLAEWISRNADLSVTVSLNLVVLALLGGSVSILLLYGPDIAEGFYQLSRKLPSALDRMRTTLGQYAWGPLFLDTLSQAGSALTDPRQLGKIAGIFSTAFGVIASFLIVIVLGLYFAAEPKIYLSSTASLFPRERREYVYDAFDKIGQVLRWWLLGRIAAMLVVGILTFIGLAILGMPFAFILSLLAAILTFVPIIGPLIAAVPAVMVGLSEGGSTALYVVILYAVIQGLENYWITPYIHQKVVSLAPAWLLMAQLIMGASFGILGLLLAPPLAVVAMVMVQMFYVRDVLGDPMELL